MQTIYSKFAKSLITLMLASSAILLAVLTGCGASTVSSNTTTAPAATSIVLTALPVSVKSDGSNSTTITATVLNSSNMVMAGQTVSFSTSTGQLIVGSNVTDSNGEITATFSAGASGSTGINRTARITATSGSITQPLDVQITGSTVTVNPLASSVLDNGTSPGTVTFTALNAGGTPVPGTPITVTKFLKGTSSDTNLVTLSSANVTPDAIGNLSGNTDSSGKFVVTVTGNNSGSGSATLKATALGADAYTDITVTTPTTLFSISGLSLNGSAASAVPASNITSMKIGDNLRVIVTAPAASSVWFASTLGVWNGGTANAVSSPVAAGAASAVLTTTQAGIADVQVYDPSDNINSNDSIKVAMTAVTANSVTLQATPSSVPKNIGMSTIVATVTDSAGQPVGGVPVGFSIVTPTGGGESVSPVVAYTATTASDSLGLGQASAIFTAGSKSTIQEGVKLRATVLGTSVVTGTAPSGSDASIIIGGTPGSVAFGQATVLRVNSNASQYILAMSAIVTDSGGNPAPFGTVVSLSLWPIAWSTGTDCTEDPDGKVWDQVDYTTGFRNYITGNGGTFMNEDVNENLILDAGEDGVRDYYFSGISATPVAGTTPTTDSHLTPANSVAGSIPATVTTGEGGVATFDLTYPKSSALFVIDRIRGRTMVQGTESIGESQFRLGALRTDLVPCLLPDSQFLF